MSVQRRRAGRRSLGSASPVAGAKDPRWNRNQRQDPLLQDHDATLKRDPKTGLFGVDLDRVRAAASGQKARRVEGLVDNTEGNPQGRTLPSIPEVGTVSASNVNTALASVRDALSAIARQQAALLASLRESGQME